MGRIIIFHDRINLIKNRFQKVRRAVQALFEKIQLVLVFIWRIRFGVLKIYISQQMGNRVSKEEQIVDRNKIEWKLENSKDAGIIHPEEGQAIMVKFAVSSEDDYKNWVSKQNANPSRGLKASFNPLGHQFVTACGCGLGGTVNAYYEHFPFLLRQEIENRKKSDLDFSFTESEMWYLIHSLAEVGRKFHHRKQKVGDIRPETIFMNDQGNIKVVNHLSYPHATTNYHKVFYDDEVTYISPEELKDIDVRRTEPTVNIQKAEAFTVGLTALDCALLDDCRNLYDLKKKQFDFEGLKKKIELLDEKKYSDTLKPIIMNLLEVEPKNRMSLSDLSKWLEPESTKIENHESFSLSQAPPHEVEGTIKSNPKFILSELVQTIGKKLNTTDVFIPKSKLKQNDQPNLGPDSEVQIGDTAAKGLRQTNQGSKIRFINGTQALPSKKPVISSLLVSTAPNEQKSYKHTLGSTMQVDKQPIIDRSSRPTDPNSNVCINVPQNSDIPDSMGNKNREN